MVIYLDLVFILNFSFDLLLLLCVSIVLKRNSKLGKLLLASLFGSLTTVFLLVNISILILNILKILMSIGMVLVGFGYKDFKYTLNNLFYLYLVSIILGGFIYYLNINYGNDKVSINYLFLLFISPVILIGYIISSKNLRNNYQHYYNCKIYFDNDNFVLVNALLDTGNKLKDPYSNKGIIILNKRYLPFDIKSPILVPFRALNTRGLLKCVKGFKLEIDKRVNSSFLIGISDNELIGDGIDCIISEKIMEGLK